MDGDQQLMLYWIGPVDAADRLAAKPELAEKFYFHYEKQESEQRPAKRALGSATQMYISTAQYKFFTILQKAF